MRTLKKTLSLVLVLAMVCSFFVMGTSAAFEDADEITADYVQAVEVMNALGIIKGDASGFRPADTLTRAEACVIITKMLGAADLATTAKTDAFTDIAGHWGEKYIAYCYEQGLISGNGDGTFAPDAELSGYAFALMILRACGYEPKNEGIGGSGWELATAKLAKNAGLVVYLDDISAATFTREMAAGMAFDGLFIPMVYYVGGSNVEINGASITTGATRQIDWYDTTNDYYETLQHSNFKKLCCQAATDAFGRVEYTWFLSGLRTMNNDVNLGYDVLNPLQDKAITSVVVPASYKFVVNSTKNDTLAEILEANKLELTSATDYVGSYAVDGQITACVAGDNVTLAAIDTALSLNTASVVELFTNLDGKVNNVVVYNYTLATIADISAAASTANYKSLVTFKDLAGSPVTICKDTQIAGWDAEAYAEKDVVVLVVDGGDNTVLSIAPAESVVGTMSSQGLGYIKVDGKQLPTAYSFSHSDYDYEYAFYLDPNGFVMDAKAVSAIVPLTYAFVSNVEWVAAVESLNGKSDARLLAELTFLDGSSKVVDLPVGYVATTAVATALNAAAPSDDTLSVGDYYTINPDGSGYTKIDYTDDDGSTDGIISLESGDTMAEFDAKFYSYTEDEGIYYLDETISDAPVVTGAQAATATNTLSVDKDAAAVTGTLSGTANSKTVLTVLYKGKATTYTGIANFPESKTYTVGTDCAGIMTLSVGGFITNIYVVATDDVTASSTATYGYVAFPGDTVKAGTYWNVFVEGKLGSYLDKASDGAAVSAPGLYTVTFNEKGELYATSATNVDYFTVGAVDETFFTDEAGVVYYFDKDCVVYNISGEFAGAVTELSKGDVVAVVTDGATKALVVYIIDAPKAISLVGVADDQTFVQNGVSIVVSGTNEDLTIKFAEAVGITPVTGATVDVSTAVNGIVAYTTAGGATDGAAYAGITLYIDVSSLN